MAMRDGIELSQAIEPEYLEDDHLESHATCPCRKSDPDIMVVQSAEDRQGYNSSGRMDDSGDRSVLDKGQMRSPYTSGAHGADVAPRGRGCDQGTPGGSSRSAVRHGRSAKAIAALSVCRECPWRECAE